MSAIETANLSRGRVLTVEIDDCAQEPYAGDKGVRIVVLHRHWTNPAAGLLDSVADVQAFEAENAAPDSEWAIFELWVMDHSGRTFKAGALGAGNPFGAGPYAQWDSGRVGVIALARAEWPAADLKTAQGVADTYGAWAEGEVYQFVISNRRGDVLDSCGGFYSVAEALAAGRDAAKVKA
ncbi:hypothetical protein D869_gp094 [Caulobacter phage CcrRogue]|uniref:Uncharacterized protein n=1 Tax=Caulobacter phage CcrRogue TaxID=2927986 RepID=K4JRA4_9CAUD|nr:hypothetical protein D869_gp007 [Caulobacter phage CcrRogue]YP_006989367.1 hypothetical protein D869_gp094 [Caulobacter phage CcrRogue]AFU86489.1 hypothetical protein CcrRogue_gp007 [Caulobacter phage CcrRogue]AFU86820.1 hypothetical protein CcrRogue_gp338 [Caulobacter phage CcrRogue]